MNYLDKLAKNIKFNEKKQKVGHLKNFAGLAVLGIAIAGAAVALLNKRCCNEIKNIVINNEENNEEDINKGINKDRKEDKNIIRDEFIETLEHVDEKSLGDVGFAMKDTIEDL